MGVNDPQVFGKFSFSVFIHLKAVRDDLFHWLDRINRSIPSGHYLKSKLTVHHSTTQIVHLTCLLHNSVFFAITKCLSTDMCSRL